MPVSLNLNVVSLGTRAFEICFSSMEGLVISFNCRLVDMLCLGNGTVESESRLRACLVFVAGEACHFGQTLQWFLHLFRSQRLALCWASGWCLLWPVPWCKHIRWWKWLTIDVPLHMMWHFDSWQQVLRDPRIFTLRRRCRAKLTSSTYQRTSPRLHADIAAPTHRWTCSANIKRQITLLFHVICSLILSSNGFKV